MKPDYKNWIPKGMIVGIMAAAVGTLAAAVIFTVIALAAGNVLRWMLSAVCMAAFLVCAGITVWCLYAYRAFSYSGKQSLFKSVIQGIAGYITVPPNGKILDVGCGSGALAIACAKKNPAGAVTGMDRWGKEYASFSKTLCENNAKAEGIQNINFEKGDALRLQYPDASFDAVTSNYVYHNIHGQDRQALILETLRVLKKGGSFAIHDIMKLKVYGDMNALAEVLQKQGYQKVELIDTTDGVFMNKKEAGVLLLSGSRLLYGTK